MQQDQKHTMPRIDESTVAISVAAEMAGGDTRPAHSAACSAADSSANSATMNLAAVNVAGHAMTVACSATMGSASGSTTLDSGSDLASDLVSDSAPASNAASYSTPATYSMTVSATVMGDRPAVTDANGMNTSISPADAVEVAAENVVAINVAGNAGAFFPQADFAVDTSDVLCGSVEGVADFSLNDSLNETLNNRFTDTDTGANAATRPISATTTATTNAATSAATNTTQNTPVSTAKNKENARPAKSSKRPLSTAQLEGATLRKQLLNPILNRIEAGYSASAAVVWFYEWLPTADTATQQLAVQLGRNGKPPVRSTLMSWLKRYSEEGMAEHSLDGILQSEAGRSLIGRLARFDDVAGVLAYLAMFRPGKSQLTFARADALLAELIQAIDHGATVGQHVVQKPQVAWQQAMGEVVGRRHDMQLPLKKHHYLYKVVQGMVLPSASDVAKVPMADTSHRAMPAKSRMQTAFDQLDGA